MFNDLPLSLLLMVPIIQVTGYLMSTFAHLVSYCSKLKQV